MLLPEPPPKVTAPTAYKAPVFELAPVVMAAPERNVLPIAEVLAPKVVAAPVFQMTLAFPRELVMLIVVPAPVVKAPDKLKIHEGFVLPLPSSVRTLPATVFKAPPE